MKRADLFAVALIFAAFASPAARSADTKSSDSNSVISSSGDKVKPGDIIYFRSDAPIFNESVAPNGDKPSTTTFCAPSNSLFEVQSITPATSAAPAADADAKGKSPTGATAADTQIVVGTFPVHSGLLHRQSVPDKATATLSKCFDSPAQPVVMGTPYEFTSDKLDKVSTQRMGFTWGAMIIPYKFYFSDKSFKSNPSTVAFAGYEGYLPGVSIAGVAALGPGLTSVSTSSGASGSTTPASNTNTSTISAVTYTAAAGFIVTFGGSIKGGVLFGRDWQGSGSGFKYENKTWMAVSIGTSF
jgi:hypothetical protein